jgi:hypothetical protein
MLARRLRHELWRLRLVVKEANMVPDLDIDPELLDRALALSGARTGEEAVTLALEEFIGRHQGARIVESFGTLDWDDAYDYQADRHRDVLEPLE